jgi:hypothetical protein
MSFSPTTHTSSSGSSHPTTRIEEVLVPSLVLSTDGSLRSPALRSTILHHESWGILEGTHQMLDQAEHRRVNVLAAVESALAVLDPSDHDDDDGHHHHHHHHHRHHQHRSNRREEEQQQATRAGRTAADAGSSSEEEEDYSSSSSRTVSGATSYRQPVP